MQTTKTRFLISFFPPISMSNNVLLTLNKLLETDFYHYFSLIFVIHIYTHHGTFWFSVKEHPRQPG